MGAVEIVVIILLVAYGIIVTILLYDQYQNQDAYMKDKVDYINKKTIDLSTRERNISAREICDKELIRLKTIHRSALDVLNSYNQIPLIV